MVSSGMILAGLPVPDSNGMILAGLPVPDSNGMILAGPYESFI